jgi:hypothetical protein
MWKTSLALLMLLLGNWAVVPALAADPAKFIFANPLKGFVRQPFSAEVEIYSGGITGDSIGAAYKSATRGDYGVRLTFGFLKALNFNLNYMYSNQSRSLVAVTPPTGILPTGTALMRAANLNLFYGNGEMNLARTKRATLYFSPGIGYARNGSRSLTLITPLGTASAPILRGAALTFNLGAGVKIFPWKRVGFRLDIRDHVSGGGTGNLNPAQGLSIAGQALANPQQYFGRIPVQNNVVFTLGLIYKIL